VRFFRLAEHRIVDQTGKGIVCYISNFSYLGDPSFVVMRQRFLTEFDTLWFDCMNGDSRETGKLTPEGRPDPSVFSTEYNREGIQLGTTIGLMVRKANRSKQPVIRFRQFWGVNKRNDLLDSLEAQNFDTQYEPANPEKSNRFSFRPSNVASHYLEWPKLVHLCAEAPSNGLMEKRRGALIDINRASLEQRMQIFYDRQVNWDILKELKTGLTEDAAEYNAKKVRQRVQAIEQYQPSRIRRYALRPFETRWCYYSDVSPLWNRSRPTLWAQCWEGNSFLLSRMKAAKDPEGSPFYFVRGLSDDHLLAPDASCFPLRLMTARKERGTSDIQQVVLLGESETKEPISIANLSIKARAYLAALGIDNPDIDAEIAGLIWMHALAIGYSPAYLTENSDGIRQDWPRIPLPDSKDLLLSSAELGRKVAMLLDTESAVPDVTSGNIRRELRPIAIIWRIDDGKLNPDVGDLNVTAGWGHAGKDGVTMPGKGKIIERGYTSNERAALKEGAEALGITVEEAIEQLGDTTCDIYLNNIAYWKNVPIKVWDYTIGGYQVIKKWLSYREHELLGRSLTVEEAREVMNMVRRIAAILLLEPALDENYRAIKSSTYAWLSSENEET